MAADGRTHIKPLPERMWAMTWFHWAQDLVKWIERTERTIGKRPIKYNAIEARELRAATELLNDALLRSAVLSKQVEPKGD